MTTLTPEEYERAVEKARKAIVDLDGKHGDPLYKGYGWIHAKDFARSLLHAHAQRRTAGTVEVCQYYRQPSCGDNEDYDNLGACGRKSCPRKATP